MEEKHNIEERIELELLKEELAEKYKKYNSISYLYAYINKFYLNLSDDDIASILYKAEKSKVKYK